MSTLKQYWAWWVVGFLFLVYVWPTPWHYETVRSGGMRIGDVSVPATTHTLRTNRFTGQTQKLDPEQGWRNVH